MKDILLIVEDDDAFREIVSSRFEQAGYPNHAVPTAEEALEWMHSASCYVIFSDLTLPGMNGIEFCRLIKADYPLAVLYAMTGYTSIFELTDCREAGFEDYFTKPVDFSLLLKAAANASEKLNRWRLP